MFVQQFLTQFILLFFFRFTQLNETNRAFFIFYLEVSYFSLVVVVAGIETCRKVKASSKHFLEKHEEKKESSDAQHYHTKCHI